MLCLSSLRLTALIGVLGTALVIAGFFLPCRFVTFTYLPNPPLYSADSFWSMLVNTVTSENFLLNQSTNLGIGSYLLALLVLLLTSLAAVLCKPKRVLMILNLVFAILGLLEFLIVSTWLLSFSRWGGRYTEIHTAGPGFWLMLGGFPLCIGCSLIAQFMLSRLHS